ncbi:MAG: hypothetical protein Q7J67_02470 [bacterium]|nr:hypothetical protein [bacterium]
MGKLMKTGVVLLLIVSLLFAVATMIIIGRNQDQKRQIANLTDDLNKTKEAKAKVEENLKNMTATKISLEKQLAQTQIERDRYKTALTSEKQKTAQLTDDIKKEIQIKDNYKTQLDKADSQISSLISQKENLNKELEKESAKRIAIEVRIARLLGKEISEKKVPGEKQERKDVPVFNENMIGKILKIDRKTGIIAIDFERDISRHTGKKLVVLRNDSLIDKITIKGIYNTIMVSKIDAFDNIRKIKDGDTVQLLNRDPTEE